jgi:hypothetical protein
MFDKLDRIIEYRALKAQLTRPERTITGTDRARYMRLRDQLPAQVPALDERDSFTLLAEPLPARVYASGARRCAMRRPRASRSSLRSRRPRSGRKSR